MEQRRALFVALAVLAAYRRHRGHRLVRCLHPALGHHPPGDAGSDGLHRPGPRRPRPGGTAPGHAGSRDGGGRRQPAPGNPDHRRERQAHDPLRAQALGQRQARHPHHGHRAAHRVHCRLRQRRRGGGETRRSDARDRRGRLGRREARRRAGRHADRLDRRQRRHPGGRPGRRRSWRRSRARATSTPRSSRRVACPFPSPARATPWCARPNRSPPRSRAAGTSATMAIPRSGRAWRAPAR